MKTLARREYEAAKDAYFARLIRITEVMDADTENYRKEESPLPQSGDVIEGPSAPAKTDGGCFAGTLNANLAVIPGQMTLFSCEIGHKQHPKCD